jgi:5-methylcytosine-specific restriction endonuclease McrA
VSGGELTAKELEAYRSGDWMVPRRKDPKTTHFQELLRTAPTRWFGRHLVHMPPDEAPFIVVKRVDGRVKGRRGEIRICARCGKEYFWMGGARVDQTTCSHACAGDHVQKTRHAISVAKGGPKKEQLDKWFSLLVRSVGSCQACGSTERLQCAHVVSRRYLSVRYDFDNAMCLCSSCHMRFTHRPLEWEEFVIERMGAEPFAALKRRALDGYGPLDRAAIAERLFALAREKGAKIGSFPGVGGFPKGGNRDD